MFSAECKTLAHHYHLPLWMEGRTQPHSLTLAPSVINNVDRGEGTTVKQLSLGRLVGDDEVHLDKGGLIKTGLLCVTGIYDR